MVRKKIILLPESWASRIAAGEVVERPASVVKELVENALDAGASEISVQVEGSGSSLIRVSDNGEGIASSDISLAFERHSTSKLQNEADLFRVSTLGFRGEALPSIASVSRLEIVSRAREEQAGCRLRIEGGKTGEPIPAGCPSGTTVEVRDLFFNTPARRKFLKTPATELSHVCDVINRMALARPDVHFRIGHGGRILSEYVAVRAARERLEQILGQEIAGTMVDFSKSLGKMRLSGFLSTAPASFSNGRHLLTFVNGRFVRDRVLTHAILQGYDTLLMKGRYPAVVLYLDLPFEEVDVNVHPAKHEVRFRHQSEIHQAVAETLREALKGEAREPMRKPERAQEPAWTGVREPALPYTASLANTGSPMPLLDRPNLEGHETEIRRGFFSSLEILGQLLGCYLVCASSRGMTLIDQHAAHERIAFEKMRSGVEAGQMQRQSLLVPQVLQLGLAEAALLEERIGLLDRLGFTVESFGPNSFAITAVPALLPSGDFREAIRAMMTELADVGASGEVLEDLEERLMTIACHSVIRAGRKLEKDEIQALLSALDQIDFATQCPHGRPVMFEFTREALERMFRRT
ncbi:MAG: DNA mismatch repair endonuclease MutL [Deltaproteobacteria bacterium]|nr:DNA mismatch repair endonuclease MutL [Deltaproteobacteria bacterium]